MKPTTDIDPAMFSNDDKFGHAFFDRFEMHHRGEPLDLGGGVRKDYLFPALYGDVTCAIAIFLCDYDGARSILPDPAMTPVRMPRGRAVVAFSNYIYRNVRGVAPYNEIAMTIPIQYDTKWTLPVLPMLWSDAPGFGYYVFGMPVTSEENRIRGCDIWGLPKRTHRIDIDVGPEVCTTNAIDEQGNSYLRLNVPVKGKPKSFDESSWVYSQLDGRTVRGLTTFAGEFHVNMNTDALVRRDARPDQSYIEIGEGGFARELRRLGIEKRPLQTRFAMTMNSAFGLPEGTATRMP